MYLEYNEDRNEFTWEELRHLAMAMGFPKDLFDKNIPNEYKEGKKISLRDLMKCFDDRCFHPDVHFTVNLKSASYNVTNFKKAIALVCRRFLSFRQLQEVRLAFEAYEAYDQKGMKISERTFLRTLKMCGRVISPKKLMHKVKHLKSSYKEEGRIQLFEFLDLLSLCEMIDDQVVADEKNSPVEKTWTKLYKVDNFKHFTVPRDEKVWRILNQKYKYEELNYNHPELVSNHFVQTPLDREDFRTQVKLANKQYETLQRNLKNSNKQVKQAKGGFTFVRPQMSPESKSAVDRLSKRATSASTAGHVSWSAVTPRAGSAKMSTTEETAVRSEKVSARKPRPMSSPPVVSERVKKDSVAKMERVQFDICTEKQRWSEHFHSTITSHLPNYHEVIKRMCKPPPAPGKRRRYRRERPSTAIISRLADPVTRPPVEHMERCDALTRGLGTDEHSVALRSNAKKVRCKSAPVTRTVTKSRSSQRSSRYSHLLESLMQQYGYVSDDESSDEDQTAEDRNVVEEEPVQKNEEESPEKTEEDNSEENLETSESEEKVDTETATIEKPSGEDQKRRFIEEYFSWKKQRKMKLRKLMQETSYYRVCLGPDGSEKPKPRRGLKLPEKSQLSTRSFCKRKPRAHHGKDTESQTDDLSAFEKHILDPENLRIRHDVCLVEDVEDLNEARRRRQAFRRIARRYAGLDKERLKSLLGSVTTPQSPLQSFS